MCLYAGEDTDAAVTCSGRGRSSAAHAGPAGRALDGAENASPSLGTAQPRDCGGVAVAP
jgi:hypothetical protein